MQLLSGLSIGHYTDTVNATGLTVFLFDPPSVCGWLLCGSAPATRDVHLLEPQATVGSINALLFSGGSAFGLGAANGVMQWLVEQGRGYSTPGGLVPIVPTACIYDLTQGKPCAPDAEAAYQACQQASANNRLRGKIGAGTGATISKLLPAASTIPGGYGYAQIEGTQGLQVMACAVVNCVGEVVDANGSLVAGNQSTNVALEAIKNGGSCLKLPVLASNSTLIALFTNAKLDRPALTRVAKMASAGMARAIVPVFTSYDGDVIFCASLGEVSANEMQVGILGAEAVRLAIIDAVQ